MDLVSCTLAKPSSKKPFLTIHKKAIVSTISEGRICPSSLPHCHFTTVQKLLSTFVIKKFGKPGFSAIAGVMNSSLSTSCFLPVSAPILVQECVERGPPRFLHTRLLPRFHASRLCVTNVHSNHWPWMTAVRCTRCGVSSPENNRIHLIHAYSEQPLALQNATGHY